MTAKVILSVLFLSVFVATGQALKCYNCLGSKTSECYQGKLSSLSLEECVVPVIPSRVSPFLNIPLEDTKQEIVAECLQTIIKLRNTDKPAYLRSCAYVYEGSDLCQLLGENVENCKSCNTDRCNGSAP